MKSEKHTAKKTNKATDFVAVGIFVYLLDRFADWFYASIVEGFFGKIFTAYSAEQSALENGFLKHYFTGNLKIKEYAMIATSLITQDVLIRPMPQCAACYQQSMR